MIQAADLLLPKPRHLTSVEGVWRPPKELSVVAPETGATLEGAAAGSSPAEGKVLDWAIDRLTRDLAAVGIALRRAGPRGAAVGDVLKRDGPGRAATGSSEVRLAIDPVVSAHRHGYRLSVGAGGALVAAPEPLGLAYGIATLRQWIRLHGDGGGERPLVLPAIEVEDRPDFEHRGVLLDVSRNKVPKLETLRSLVDRLASWKVNQLQLYMEHTFAYRGHEEVWRDADPYTADDMRRLARYCAERGIDLVPNQNSFGHFHRWLIHEPYRHLAECPEGIEHPFSDQREPFSLCADDPAVLDLLAGLYDQLLPCFSSGLFNVGLDETFDLGRCRSAEACRRDGKERVYLRFLREVRRLARERGRRMMFWGDVVLEHPDLVPELPADGIALAWGYEADHPFADNARRFAAAGVEFYVCPGTCGWSSFAGRTGAALGSIAAAARHGREHGASGLLVTDWGDHGHLQPLAVSYPGLAAAAGLGWNAREGARVLEDPDLLAARLDRHVFGDRAGRTGRALLDLGSVYRLPGAVPKNGSALFFLLHFAHLGLTQPRLDGLSDHGLAAAEVAIEEAGSALAGARLAAPDGELVGRELAWAAAMLSLSARFGRAWMGAGRDRPPAAIPAAARAAFAGELQERAEELRPIWLARNRAGGMEPSIARMLSLKTLLDSKE